LCDIFCATTTQRGLPRTWVLNVFLILYVCNNPYICDNKNKGMEHITGSMISDRADRILDEAELMIGKLPPESERSFILILYAYRKIAELQLEIEHIVGDPEAHKLIQSSKVEKKTHIDPIDHLIDAIKKSDVKITFGIQKDQIDAIEEESRKWDEMLQEGDSLKPGWRKYEHSFWEMMGRRFSWSPLSLALAYFEHCDNM
jgi:hypothetical protein